MIGQLRVRGAVRLSLCLTGCLTGCLTEVKNAYAGAKYARQAKDVGISKAIINEPLDPRGAARLSEGVRRYEDIWKTAWKKKRRSKLLRELRENIECTIRGIMFDVLGTAASAGVSTLSEGVADELREAGLLSRAQAELLDTIFTTWRDNNRDLAVTVIQAGLDCDDKDETVVALVELVIQDLIEFDLLQKLANRIASAVLWIRRDPMRGATLFQGMVANVSVITSRDAVWPPGRYAADGSHRGKNLLPPRSIP